MGVKFSGIEEATAGGRARRGVWVPGSPQPAPPGLATAGLATGEGHFKCVSRGDTSFSFISYDEEKKVRNDRSLK